MPSELRFDPLQQAVDLPLRNIFYPLGFPLQVETNASCILESAAESWGTYQPRFSTRALRLRIAVSPEGGPILPPSPVFRAQGHLMSIISDRENFAVCDLARGYSYARLTSAVAAARGWWRHHFLEAITYTTLSHKYVTSVHAACIAKDGRGMLLCGPSGAGKSTLAFACARDGWAFVSDDVSDFLRAGDQRQVLGRPHRIGFLRSARELFPELDGRPAIHGADGQELISVATSELGMETAAVCVVDRVLFLSRCTGKTTRLSTLSTEEAYRLLLKELPVFAAPVHKAHKKSLRMLASLPVHELHYSELGEAVRVVDSLGGENGPIEGSSRRADRVQHAFVRADRIERAGGGGS
jgi:hypothetical protein